MKRLNIERGSWRETGLRQFTRQDNVGSLSSHVVYFPSLPIMYSADLVVVGAWHRSRYRERLRITDICG